MAQMTGTDAITLADLPQTSPAGTWLSRDSRGRDPGWNATRLSGRADPAS